MKTETTPKAKKPEMVRSVKSATMKVREDAKMLLFPVFAEYLRVGGAVKDRLFNLGKNEDTAAIYKDYVGQPQRGRGATTTVFTTLDKDKKYTGKTSFPARWRDAGVFPLYDKPAPDSYNLTTAGYHYSINAVVHEQLDSHNECDKACATEYNAAKANVEELRNQLDGEFGSKTVEKFFGFIEKTMLLGWRFDEAFQSYFKYAMHPGLKAGSTSVKPTYKLENGKTKRYSFYSDAVRDEIVKNKVYWPLLESGTALEWIRANSDLFYKKERAQYTSTTLTKAQLRMYFGNNGIPFTAKTSDGYAYFSFRLPSIGEKRGEVVNIPCAYAKVYNGKVRKSCYFGDLTIENAGEGKYTCKYSVNHKRPQVATLNECFLRLVVRNKSYFNKLVTGTLTKNDGPMKPSYFDFYFDLALNVEETPIHKLSFSEVFGKLGLRAYYSSAWPETKNLGGQKTVKTKTACPIKKAHNIMGIDLGQRNPFAYCVKNQAGEVLESGHLEGSTNDTYKMYVRFGDECSMVTGFIKDTRKYLYGVEDAITQESFAKVKGVVGFDLSYAQYLAYLDQKKTLVNKDDQKKTTIHLLRQEGQDWIGRDCLWYLRKQYGKINLSRMTDADWKQTLYWVDALYRFVDANKAFFNFGSYYDMATKTRVHGTGKNFCSNYWDQINNLNDDMLKKFAFALLPVVKKHGVSVLVVEKLDSMLGDSSRIAQENRNYNLWPVGQLKTFLESRLTPFNVAFIEVDERNTSQVCDGEWVYRNANDVYYFKNGKLNTVHADENAASNIVDRALSKHTNLFSLHMVNPAEDYYVPTSIWNPKEEGGKRVRGFLTKWYKNSDTVFVKKDGKLVKSKMSVKDLKKLVGKNKVERGSFWYRVNQTEWVDEVARDAIINAAKQKALASAKVAEVAAGTARGDQSAQPETFTATLKN